VSGTPSTEVSADLTGSGISDLVVLDKQNSTVSVLLGNGDGTFQAPHVYSGINYPRTVAIADVNGDGHPDIVIGANNGSIDVLLGNGNGTFKSAITTTIDPNGGKIIVAVADLTGDGDQDIIAADKNNGILGVLLNNGSGVFAPPRLYSVGTYPSSIAVGNLGNGHEDILVANEYSGTVSVMLGNGDGSFKDGPTLAVGDDPESIALGDLNGDGKPDLIVGDAGAYYQRGDTASVSVFLGNGDGTFKPPMKTVLQGDRLGQVAVGQLTGDGRNDVVVTTGYEDEPTDLVDVLLGNGDGTLQAPATFVVLNSPSTVSITDVNDDGKPDIVVPAEQHKGLSILINTASPLIFTPPKLVPTGNGPDTVVTADLNGDGIPDVVVGNQVDNTVQVFLGNGNGTFKAPETYSVATDPQQVLVANLGNGSLDIVEISQSSGDVTVLKGNGSGHFTALPAFPTTEIGFGPNPMTLANLSGNGDMDLVVADDSSGMIDVYQGNGDGTFNESPADYSMPMGAYAPSAFAVTSGVFTGTLPDIAVTDVSNNQVDVFLNNGSGGLDSVPGTYPVGTYPTSLAVADVNGDSKQDLVVADKYGSEVSVLLGNGDGTFAPQQTFATGKYPSQVIAADVNGDGKMDIITANAGNSDSPGHSVDILLGNGNGTFALPQVLLTGNYPRSVAATDLNGDGKTDLIIAAQSDNDLNIFLGGKPTIASGSSGAVTVQGSGGNDMTTVGYAGGKVIVNIDGQSQSFTKTALGAFAIMLGGGNSTLSISAGVPAVSIQGGSGNSSIIAGSADATIHSGSGNDFIVSSGKASSIKANSGNEDIVADARIETIHGGTGIDTIDPLKGGDSLKGGTGTSFFLDAGAKHPDTIVGGTGFSFAQYNPADTMSNIFQIIDPPPPSSGTAVAAAKPAASAGPADASGVTAQVVDGELKIVGTSGSDTISLTTDGANIDIAADGGSLTPVPLSGLTDIRVNGRGGADSIILAGDITLPATLDGNGGADTLVGGGGDNVLVGGPGGDSLVGGAGTNLLVPDQNTSFLSGPAGNDTLDGGTGFSIADFSYRTDALTLSNNGVADSGDTGQGEASKIMTNVSAIWGGSGGNTITGATGGEFLSGGDGANSVHGGGVNDLLVGGGGNDTVIVAAEPVSLYLINGKANEYGGVNNPSEDILQLDSLDTVIS
jgi:Ca2+-binding RTX toxin-like protein